MILKDLARLRAQYISAARRAGFSLAQAELFIFDLTIEEGEGALLDFESSDEFIQELRYSLEAAY